MWISNYIYYGKLYNSPGGSGDIRLFYQFAFPDVLDKIINHIPIALKANKIAIAKEHISEMCDK